MKAGIKVAKKVSGKYRDSGTMKLLSAAVDGHDFRQSRPVQRFTVNDDHFGSNVQSSVVTWTRSRRWRGI